jgi:hypothetical protein
MDKENFDTKTCENSKGYLLWRDSRRLVHRTIAYNKIYLKDKKRYPLPFSEYQVHHRDGNKKNNIVNNLEILCSREHEVKHKIIRYEPQAKNTFVVLLVLVFSWFVYLGLVGGYRYDFEDVGFMMLTFIIAWILIYFINKKKKGYRYI